MPSRWYSHAATAQDDINLWRLIKRRARLANGAVLVNISAHHEDDIDGQARYWRPASPSALIRRWRWLRAPAVCRHSRRARRLVPPDDKSRLRRHR